MAGRNQIKQGQAGGLACEDILYTSFINYDSFVGKEHIQKEEKGGYVYGLCGYKLDAVKAQNEPSFSGQGWCEKCLKIWEKIKNKEVKDG